MKWTDEQTKAISYRGGNLLVSAAAGSGKTAVLVERIIGRVLDAENPIDIDSIVVVTFTKAAAAEMKARLNKAFEKALSDNPGNRHLLRQLSLIDNARITTIDSFCKYLVSNYYNSINLDPSFRIADEGELRLLKSDILEEIIEKNFKKEDKIFYDFVDAYAPGKSIDQLSDYILKLYDFSQSYPSPLEWLDKCRSIYDVKSAKECEDSAIIKNTMTYILLICKEILEEYDTMIDICGEPGAPAKYVKTFEKDRLIFEQAIKATDYEELRKALSLDFVNLERADANCDKEISEVLKECRNSIKSRKNKICNDFLSESMENVYKQIENCRPMADIFLNMTKEFLERYSQLKREKNLMDFSDIEHFALNILVKDGEPTAVADELAKQYKEIYIDEYQDSNEVQEIILRAVSTERFNKPDTFMVGDVKQSIYKFRMARPELFMEKYEKYTEKEPYCKIELHSNFRSRPNVLNCINDIFFQIMYKSIGGIEYTNDVKLNPGIDMSELDMNVDDCTEIIQFGSKEIEGVASATVVSAHIAADRIKQLVNEEKYKYKDIVILLRSDKNKGAEYAGILNSHGIPCVFSSSVGYFEAFEVKTVMNYLSVIDNPRQEIELAAVMKSYFFGFSDEELAKIKGNKRRTELFDCVIKAMEAGDEISLKCKELIKELNQMREYSKLHTIKELLTKLIYTSGFYDFVRILPSGKISCANLEMLIQKAADYEKTSYTGLFNFLRYINKLIKYETDYGEAQILSEEDNVVRVMTIHKSKGLEFPVVILSEIGSTYNKKDISDDIIFDSTYGIGMNYIDPDKRIKTTTMLWSSIANKITLDDIGEELRILYVAMTRAKNKLIMIGSKTNKDEKKWIKTTKLKINSSYVATNSKYADLIMPCIDNIHNNGRFVVKTIDKNQIISISEEIIQEEVENSAKRYIKIIENHKNEKDITDYKKLLEYKYPFDYALKLKAKYAVSDLKHQAIEESENLAVYMDTPDKTKPVPLFVEQSQEEKTGTFRGTAYHKFFELLDYDKTSNLEEIKSQIEKLKKNGKLPSEYAVLLNPNKFLNFINTELGQNMKNAAIQKRLYREQPFVMEVSAAEVDATYPENEYVIVQGIIDAFYIEDDRVVVIDYKTDHAFEEIIIERYKKQLELYCEALRKITGKAKCECYIYSVYLDKSFQIPI